jgi:ubiquinone biosynthesis protein COQ9
MNNKTVTKKFTAEPTIARRCVQSCQKLLAGIEHAKRRITEELRETLATQNHSFQLALKEAEALAFQTAYPHLLFPTLAVEKIQAVSAWQHRQQQLQRQHEILAA